MKSLNAVEVFVHVAEARSFVVASRILGVSPSAVSKTIARLEQRLGIRLFHRSTRNVALTFEGGQFLERCRRILAELESAHVEFSRTSAQPSGRLRVSAPPIGVPFMRLFGEFQRQFPEVQLDLDISDRLVDIVEEGFDVVLRSGEPRDSRLAARSLGTFRYVLVGAPQYLDERGEPMHPHDLAQHACIQFRYPSTGKLKRWTLTREGKSYDIELPLGMTCNSAEGRIAYAKQGLGVTYASDFMVRDAIEHGELRTVLNEYLAESGTLTLLWPSSQQITPKLRAFIDFIVEHSPLA